MVSNVIAYLGVFSWWPLLLAAIIGFFLGWLLFGRKSHVGDLSREGESALQKEANDLRARVRELEAGVKTRDGEIGDMRTKLMAAAAGGAAASAIASASDNDTPSGDDDATYALEWRNRYLAARVKYLEGRVSDGAKPAKAKAAPKKAPKKATNKKITAKKSTAKKATAATATAASAVATADDAPKKRGRGRPRKDPNAPVKPKAKTKAKAKVATTGEKRGRGRPRKTPTTPEKGSLEWYYENVQRYHGTAAKAVVKSIKGHLGIALQSRDTSLVACSDPKEVDTVVKNWCVKKLEQSEDAAAANVASVCEEMKKDRFKDRVTFYYLCAKNARKLSAMT